MRLCDLPPELLAEVLRFTDPSTFYILTQLVAPFLTEAAASSKGLLLYQLGALPGLKYGLEDLTLQELISCFQERAAKNLCGIDALADVTLFDFGLLNFHVRQSMFYPQFNGADCLFMVHRDEPCVYIFALCLRGGPPRFKTVVDLREQYDLGDFRKMSIKKIAVSPYGKRWAVLYKHQAVRVSPYGKRWNGVPTTFMVERMKEQDETAWPRHNYRVAIINQDNDMYHLMLDNPSPLYFDQYEAVGFGISDDDHAAICWRFISFECGEWDECEWNEACTAQAQARLRREFRGKRAQNGPCELPAKITYDSGNIRKLHPVHYPIHEIKFTPDNGSHLLFFNPRSPIHSMHLEYSQGVGLHSIDLNNTLVDGLDGAGVDEAMGIGIPFYASHTTSESEVQDHALCTMVWLSVGASLDFPTEDAYIVRAIRTQPFNECDCEPNVGSGIWQFDWEAMVRLRGFMRSTSSLGSIVAISEDSRRLVVADWKSLRLWPLDPAGLIENDIDHYCSTNRKSAFEIDSGIGSIEPFELPASGDVIHKLFFTGKDLLHAVTDRGMTVWDLGQHAGGRSAAEQSRWKNPPHYSITNPKGAEAPTRICAIFRE